MCLQANRLTKLGLALAGTFGLANGATDPSANPGNPFESVSKSVRELQDRAKRANDPNNDCWRSRCASTYGDVQGILAETKMFGVGMPQPAPSSSSTRTSTPPTPDSPEREQKSQDPPSRTRSTTPSTMGPPQVCDDGSDTESNSSDPEAASSPAPGMTQHNANGMPGRSGRAPQQGRNRPTNAQYQQQGAYVQHPRRQRRRRHADRTVCPPRREAQGLPTPINKLIKNKTQIVANLGENSSLVLTFVKKAMIKETQVLTFRADTREMFHLNCGSRGPGFVPDPCRLYPWKGPDRTDWVVCFTTYEDNLHLNPIDKTYMISEDDARMLGGKVGMF